MSTATLSNSQPQRKQLSDQLDRLDGLLDGLSEGLNQAVADAAREGTRLAVKDAIVEIMTDPAQRAQLHQATAPEPAPSPVPKPGFWARLKARTRQAVAAAVDTSSRLMAKAIGTGRKVAEVTAEGVQAVRGLGSLKNLALVGVGVGLAVGVASFLAPHAVAAAVSGISGAIAATAIQLGVWTRRTFRALTLV